MIPTTLVSSAPGLRASSYGGETRIVTIVGGVQTANTLAEAAFVGEMESEYSQASAKAEAVLDDS